MRHIALLVLSVALLGACGEHITGSVAPIAVGGKSTANPWLQGLADALLEAPPAPVSPLTLAVDVQETAGHVTLNFLLRNLSTDPIQLPQATLPWETEFLSVTALTVMGKLPPRMPGIGRGISEDDVPPISLEPGDFLEGSVDLDRFYPRDALPRDTDVLLLWSYRHGDQSITGIALLPKHRA